MNYLTASDQESSKEKSILLGLRDKKLKLNQEIHKQYVLQRNNNYLFLI